MDPLLYSWQAKTIHTIVVFKIFAKLRFVWQNSSNVKYSVKLKFINKYFLLLQKLWNYNSQKMFTKIFSQAVNKLITFKMQQKVFFHS